jgi:hypothetical protein
MQSQLAFVPLVVLAAVGVVLTYFAYEVSGLLLALVGYAVGAGAGFGAGLALQSGGGVGGAVGNDGIVIVGIAVVVGAIVGRIVVPALSQLAVGVLGFVTTTLSALAVMTQGRVAEALRVALPTSSAQAPPARLIEYVLADPSLQGQAFQETMLIAGGVGLVGGLIATAYYRAVISLVLTGVGAVGLSVAGPVLLFVLTSSETTTAAPGQGFSPLWMAVAFATGVLFQYVRHSDDLLEDS